MSTTYPNLPKTTFPDTIQAFPTMADIVASDGVNIAGFQTAMEAGDTATAQTYYAKISNADNKFINADKLNTLFQTCQALENFYATDVEEYITNKQTEWENIINRFDYVGTYSSTKQYVVNNWVDYTALGLNQLYMCIAQPPVGTAPTNTTYWKVLTIRGQQGASGSQLSFQGDWNSTTPYTTQDVVAHNNTVWGCTQANTNVEPVSGSDYWQVLYHGTPTSYPVQQNQPATASTGDLWFEIKDGYVLTITSTYSTEVYTEATVERVYLKLNTAPTSNFDYDFEAPLNYQLNTSRSGVKAIYIWGHCTLGNQNLDFANYTFNGVTNSCPGGGYDDAYAKAVKIVLSKNSTVSLHTVEIEEPV